MTFMRSRTQLQGVWRTLYKGLGISLLVIATQSATAAQLDITAKFDPDIRNPTSNKFENTTPNTGYCLKYPTVCAGKTFSLRIPNRSSVRAPLVIDQTMGIRAPYSWKELEVSHSSGSRQTVRVRITGVGGTYALSTAAGKYFNGDHAAIWKDGTWSTAPAGCTATAMTASGPAVYYFFWRFNSDNECAKTSKVDFDAAVSIENVDIMYELQTPNPLEMNTGTYSGSISYTVGPNGELKLGEAPVNDSILTLNFTLTVQHTLQIQFPANATLLALAPQGGWQQWLINGDNFRPQKLVSNQPFQLWSSTRFKMQLLCQYPIGEDCGLQNDAGDKKIPVKTMVTLPSGLQELGNNPVNRSPLRNNAASLFLPNRFVENERATLHFEVEKQGVEQMIDNGGGRYRGDVTIIWDSQI